MSRCHVLLNKIHCLLLIRIKKIHNKMKLKKPTILRWNRTCNKLTVIIKIVFRQIVWRERNSHKISLIRVFKNNCIKEEVYGHNIALNVKSNIEQVLAARPPKAPTIRSPTTYHENYPS